VAEGGNDCAPIARQGDSGGDDGVVASGAATQRPAALGYYQAMARTEEALAHRTRQRACVHGASQRGDVGPPGCGDHTHLANQPEIMSCTNFKASIKTKRLLLELNHLHHAQEGISGYQPELKHDTTS